MLADLISANKRMLEELVWREKLSQRGLMEQKFGRITVDRSWANRATNEDVFNRMTPADPGSASDKPVRAPSGNGAVDTA